MRLKLEPLWNYSYYTYLFFVYCALCYSQFYFFFVEQICGTVCTEFTLENHVCLWYFTNPHCPQPDLQSRNYWSSNVTSLMYVMSATPVLHSQKSRKSQTFYETRQNTFHFLRSKIISSLYFSLHPKLKFCNTHFGNINRIFVFCGKTINLLKPTGSREAPTV